MFAFLGPLSTRIRNAAAICHSQGFYTAGSRNGLEGVHTQEEVVPIRLRKDIFLFWKSRLGRSNGVKGPSRSSGINNESNSSCTQRVTEYVVGNDTIESESL